MKAVIFNLLDFLIEKLTRIKNKIIMNQATTEQQIYVWTKTERAGDIVEVAAEQKDPKWLEFTDGSRINKSIVDEMLIIARDEQDAAQISATFGGIGAAKSPAQKARDAAGTTKSQTQERRITDGKSAPDPEVNVMMEMLKKISKKNTAAMPVSVNIPAKEVYEMLQDQMDLGADELNEQIGLLVESQIDSLREQLKEQIESFITNYYKNESRKQHKLSNSSE